MQFLTDSQFEILLIGNQVQWSLLDNFVSLTPEVEQDNEDMHAMECMTIHGVLGSGIYKILCF